ncbi:MULTISPECIES: DUF3106 domain-containing protein [unclassified Paraburkholderia]|uniref:DUF3106 domain-containing protein n=1 Tax=unclassified Paraburkholderia TaxID=2615204 RepID=UPI002AB20C78|nr:MULTISPECIES: DUF3106 domain-containing protein [unclassified Paraburkholderia]
MSYKRGLAVVIGCVVTALVSYAATYPRFHPELSAPESAATAAPAQGQATASDVTVAAAAPAAPGNENSDNPLSWSRLTDAQRTALAPFASEWDKFSDARKRKWLRIAARYPKMTPDVQKRLQERMTEWVRMTPEQRRVARENYQVSKELPPQARQRAWKAYQELSEEQKAKLAATERRRRTVVSAPPSGNKSEIRDIERLVNERERRARARTAAGASAPAPAAPGLPGTSGQLAEPPATAMAASIPAAGSFEPAIPVPVSPAEAPAAFKGS